MPFVDDDALMVRLAGGDSEALREIIRRHGQQLAGFLRQMTGDAASADDLAQDAFLRVYRNSARYVPGGGFRSWLYTIARHLALNHLRDRRLETPAVATPLESPAPDGGERTELQSMIERAIDAVPEPFRSALLLCVLHGLSYEEAAEASGCSVKTLSSRLARGRERFRELVAPYLTTGAPLPAVKR